MATMNFYVSNPTSDDVTVDALTAPAGHVVELAIDPTGTDLAGFIEAGCCVASAAVTTTVDANVQLVEKGAHLLESLVRAVVSAGTDTFAQAGL